MFRQNAVSTLASGKTLFPSCYVWHEKESPENRKQLFHSTVTTKPSSNLCSTQSTQAQEKPWAASTPWWRLTEMWSSCLSAATSCCEGRRRYWCFCVSVLHRGVPQKQGGVTTRATLSPLCYSISSPWNTVIFTNNKIITHIQFSCKRQWKMKRLRLST